jgi:hypothetical protein
MKSLTAGLTLALGILLAAACAGLWWQHRHAAALTVELDTAKTAALSADFEASAARADVERVTVYADRVRVIHDTVTTIQRDIPRYVTPEVDRALPLSTGFVRVLDAAAAGVPLAEDPQHLDAHPSTVAPSDAAAVIAGNYGTCRETAATLEAVQAWAVDHGLADPSP